MGNFTRKHETVVLKSSLLVVKKCYWLEEYRWLLMERITENHLKKVNVLRGNFCYTTVKYGFYKWCSFLLCESHSGFSQYIFRPSRGRITRNRILIMVNFTNKQKSALERVGIVRAVMDSCSWISNLSGMCCI